MLDERKRLVKVPMPTRLEIGKIVGKFDPRLLPVALSYLRDLARKGPPRHDHGQPANRSVDGPAHSPPADGGGDCGEHHRPGALCVPSTGAYAEGSTAAALPRRLLSRGLELP
jgi:hypothetical protein